MAEKLVKDIYSQFSKKELQEIAAELEIANKGSETTRTLATVILADLEKNGIPEDLDDISDNLFDLLVTAEFIDEEGNIIETEEAEPISKEASVIEKVVEIPDWICFSYADPRDPACNRCKLYNPCWEKRLTLSPPCFGIQYNASDAECQKCIENSFCKKETENHG